MLAEPTELFLWRCVKTATRRLLEGGLENTRTVAIRVQLVTSKAGSWMKTCEDRASAVNSFKRWRLGTRAGLHRDGVRYVAGQRDQHPGALCAWIRGKRAVGSLPQSARLTWRPTNGHQRTDSADARTGRVEGMVLANSKRPQTPRNLAVSLSIEAAEVLEHFQFREDVKDKDELAGELAT